MIDSNDRERISECQEELQRVLCEDELRNSILLVLANKQDLPNAMSVQEITEKLGLNSLRAREWCKFPLAYNMHSVSLSTFIPSIPDIQSTCATSGDGLYEGLDWLKGTLSKKMMKKTLTQPLTETAESASDAASKPSLLSSWLSSISGYFHRTTITA